MLFFLLFWGGEINIYLILKMERVNFVSKIELERKNFACNRFY